MKQYVIVYTEAARSDLVTIGDHLKDRAGVRIARTFVDRLIATIETLDHMPERHRVRLELAPDVRVIGFRRYLIFYVVEEDTVVVVRVLHGSPDITGRLFRR